VAGGKSNNLDSDMMGVFKRRREDLSYPPAWSMYRSMYKTLVMGELKSLGGRQRV